MNARTQLPTGHAHHFLSRLDRVSRPHVELALSIYRDQELLRFVLGRARAPERAERVAISLEHPEEGPFVIVTREGRFVTCLGEGMHPGPSPVITRGQLDAAMARFADVRARDDARRRRFGEDGETAVILRRLLAAGDGLSREEFVAVSSIAPLLRRDLAAIQLHQARDLAAARDQLLRLLVRARTPHACYRQALRTYWDEVWSIGHLSVLAAMNGPDLVAELPELPWREHPAISLAAVDQGMTAVALKGIWAASKLGKSVLAGYKRALAEEPSWPGLLDAGLALTGLGLRHARLRAEVQKTLAAARVAPGDDATTEGRLRVVEMLAALAAPAFDDPAGCTRAQREAGASMLVQWGQSMPTGARYRFDRVEDVPEELALTVAAQSRSEYLYAPRAFAGLFAYLPWLAHAEPERLYLPAELLRAVHAAWAPEDTLSLLRSQLERAPRPGPAPEGPSRGGPCPCGSGKKHKRCCGDARREGAARKAA
jgi:hypothetical protein